MNLNDVEKKMLLLPRRFHEKFPDTYDELYNANLLPERIEDVKDLGSGPEGLTPGLWILSRTFERTLERAIKEDWDSFCWIEDDVMFSKDFDEVKNIQIPEGFDVIYYGCTAILGGTKINDNFFEPNLAHGTHFIVCMKSSYNTMLKAFKNPDNISQALDNTIHISGVKKCSINPNKVWQRKKPHESEEQVHYNQETGSCKHDQEVRNSIYKHENI